MKTTPYTDLHIKLGAKMAEFAGYNMPIQYTTLIEEHNNVRNNVGVFDVSHMGEFRAKGPIAKHFMQYVTTNNRVASSTTCSSTASMTTNTSWSPTPPTSTRTGTG